MGIIDFHTHTFETAIVERAMNSLKQAANIESFLDGSETQLIQMNKKEEIALSVVLPVATKPGQGDKINASSIKKNERFRDTGLVFFAAIHPADEDIKHKLLAIKEAGFKGIKLHPAYQKTNADDISYMRLIDLASQQGLITVIHAGGDISFPENDMSSVKRLLKIIDQVHPQKFVLAHMGGWNEWDLVESDLAGAGVYLDTSFCLSEPMFVDNRRTLKSFKTLQKEQFLRLVKKHGVERILFGTDSPWSDRKNEIGLISGMGMSESEQKKLFYENAAQLLQL